MLLNEVLHNVYSSPNTRDCIEQNRNGSKRSTYIEMRNVFEVLAIRYGGKEYFGRLATDDVKIILKYIINK
jgi:hypothetical protein